jgi:hypothetical protein
MQTGLIHVNEPFAVAREIDPSNRAVRIRWTVEQRELLATPRTLANFFRKPSILSKFSRNQARDARDAPSSGTRFAED